MRTGVRVPSFVYRQDGFELSYLIDDIIIPGSEKVNMQLLNASQTQNLMTLRRQSRRFIFRMIKKKSSTPPPKRGAPERKKMIYSLE